MSGAMSPPLVAEYQTRLPEKKRLQVKLHEFDALAELQAEADDRAEIRPRPAAQWPAPTRERTGPKKA